MSTLIKIIVATILSIFVTSCNFDMNFSNGVRGDSNVKSAKRTINASFNAIDVTNGLDVYITQSDFEAVNIRADENLHDLIITEVKNDVLYIYADESIGYASSKKILVNFKDVTELEVTGGSDLYSTNKIVATNLTATTTSGSDMEIEVEVETLNAEATSGSDLRIVGNTNKFFAEATSGSDIKAGKLKANICNAEATSGADITVNTSLTLHATASSGGDITYYGNPKKVDTNDGVSGSIRSR